jgi:hypothetical protein
MCSLTDLGSTVPSPVSNAQLTVLPTRVDDSNAASDPAGGCP